MTSSGLVMARILPDAVRPFLYHDLSWKGVMDLIKITPKTHVIVTGGAGFIGSYLSARLLSSGAQVTILTRHVEAPRARQLATQGATVLAWDATSQPSAPVMDCLAAAQVFCHLAADVSVRSPRLHATNVNGTRRALELAAEHEIPYFVYASSIEAQGLGSDQEIPLCEDAPCRPVSEYGQSKAEAEQVVAEWAKAPGHSALVLRIGNIYGPGSAWMLHPCL